MIEPCDTCQKQQWCKVYQHVKARQGKSSAFQLHEDLQRIQGLHSLFSITLDGKEIVIECQLYEK